MSEVQNILEGPCPRPGDSIGSDRAAVFDGRSDTRLRLVPGLDEPAPASQAAPALPDWTGLVDLVRAAARRLRQIEAHAEDRDRSCRQALRRARDAVVSAERQAQQAETLADAAGRRADTRIAAAAARADAAEACARAADARAGQAGALAARVQAAIVSEFPDSTTQAAA
ncbi:hypothetical protein MKK84_30750 [Methylobacterium sp. E-065]|uniref:hypothetical protein n=1 Tax=Methylobacterium sp. E-065 TaxID=2836583 RepID=UPI001FBA0D6B|nr:hypothetical protein [Methylobacterium sp. E-065]MCJ2021742.1 hypothetical protein [Methylobacterium sp. E-065]